MMLRKYYTTQMSDNARQLQTRFSKMRTKPNKKCKIFACMVSVSIIITVACASFVMAAVSSKIDTEYTVYNGDEKINLVHTPFIYESDYYLPLRNVLNGFGITDIEYDNGKITITIPTVESEPEIYSLEIGKDMLWSSVWEWNGIILRGAPILVNDMTTYVSIDFFELFARFIPECEYFRLDVKRPTEPEYYYEEGEEVFVGTAGAQDLYNPVDENGNPKLVKRIIVDENYNTLAVVPVENQIPENIKEKSHEVGSAAVLNGYSGIYDTASFYYSPDEKREIAKTDFYVITTYNGENSETRIDRQIAFIAAADIVTPIINEFNKDMEQLVVNSYNDK